MQTNSLRPLQLLCCRIQLKHEGWEEGKAAKEAIPSLRLCAVLPCPLPGQAASPTTLPKPAARCPVPSPPCPYPCLHPRYLLPHPQQGAQVPATSFGQSPEIEAEQQ